MTQAAQEIAWKINADEFQEEPVLDVSKVGRYNFRADSDVTRCIYLGIRIGRLCPYIDTVCHEQSIERDCMST